MIQLQTYRSEMRETWNDAVRASRNGTFLFDRGFMDYHSDRFTDASLMFIRNGSVVALLPQTRHGSEWRSHGGLTYGGLVLSSEMTVTDVLEISDQIVEHAGVVGVSRQIVTPVPYIYHRQPSDEVRYALFQAGAKLTASKIDSVVNLRNPLKVKAQRKTGARRGLRAGLRLDDQGKPEDLHELVRAGLLAKHGVSPVHSAAEMQLLQSRFPSNIRCWQITSSDEELVAGAWVFESETCAHLQYSAASDKGRELRALDLLFSELIEYYPTRKDNFCFGTSNEGVRLNEGLLRQKTSFGARGVVHETFEWIFA